MSFENSLERIAVALEQLIRIQTNTITQAEKPDVSDTVVQLPADSEPLKPVTQEDIAAANQEFNKIMEAGVPVDSILSTIAKHGVSQLAQVGDNRPLFDAILADVRALHAGIAT